MMNTPILPPGGERRRLLSRREGIALLTSAGTGALLFGSSHPARAHTGDAAHGGYPDALTHHNVDVLKHWRAWLDRAGADGFLGETTVPSTAQGRTIEEVEKWKVNFDFFLTDCRDLGLHVSLLGASRFSSPNEHRIYGPYNSDLPVADRAFGTPWEQAR